MSSVSGGLKHTSQTEPRDMRPETSQKIRSNLRRLPSISPPLTPALCVFEHVCLSLAKRRLILCESKREDSLYSLYPRSVANKLICCLFAFIYVSLVLSPSRPQTHTPVFHPETSAQDAVFVKKKLKKPFEKRGKTDNVCAVIYHTPTKQTYSPWFSITNTYKTCTRHRWHLILAHVKR